MPQVDQYGQTIPIYDYSQYPYYQVPMRNYPMQFPGFQNVNYPQYPIDRSNYPHQQGGINPQDPYAQFAYQMSQHPNMNNYYQGHSFTANPYLKK
jgi:hypothetical protein